MGRQPCYAAGVEGAVVIETAEHESHGREEKEIGKCRKKFCRHLLFSGSSSSSSCDSRQVWPVLWFSSHRVTPGIIVSCSALLMALGAFNALHLNVTTCVNETEHLRPNYVPNAGG